MPALIQRRKAVLAFGTVLVVFIALVVPLVSHAIAQGTPRIGLLNPSGFADDTVDETPLIISDLHTGTDETDDPNEDTYRLNAWTANTPPEALVEFEVEIPTVGGAIGQTLTLGTADHVGPDAFEYNWNINVPDGSYLVRAILYEGSGVFAEEVARAERNVRISRGDPAPEESGAAAPTVDITYPPNGGPAGFYTNPLTGATNILVDYELSDDTDSVEVFYTLSDPGDEGVWKSCAYNTYGALAAADRVVCPLESQDQGGQSVTSIAAVANDDDSAQATFQATTDPRFNASGDAVRVLPYDQDATTIDIDKDTARADSDDGDWVGVCAPAQFATVNDQMGRPISDLNIDVHASGPSDQTKFFTGTTGSPFFAVAPSTNNKAPDKGHGTELGYHCSFATRPEVWRNQGDHNRVGAPDIKHLESSGGGLGRFGVRMHADTEGETFITFWADEDDDDVFCSQELSVAASVGFDAPAPAPVLEPAGKDICPIPTPPPPGASPAPSGSPSTSPSNPPDDPRGCTVIGTEGDDKLTGTEGDDIICGLGGDDQIQAGGGDDLIYGDAGDDQINAGGGDDTVEGADGVDALFGAAGRDAENGGTGSDIVAGGGGDDRLVGSAAGDTIIGNGGRDILTGGGGGDALQGGNGDDILKGSGGKDDLEGGGGADTMRGGPKNDRMDGGPGPDTMRGGPGKDRCVGGPGKDRQSSC